MASTFETIIAPITGPGPAAVTVVRLSGDQSWQIAARLFPSLESNPNERYAHYGTFETGDDGYLILYREGRSYTGEASAEISIHGSIASVNSLLGAALSKGARMAEPGEFTQRAFMNGRIDLTQAEAVRDTIEARTQAQLRLANLHREGELYKRVKEIEKQLMGVLAAIEAHTDFSEEIGELDPTELAKRISEAEFKIDELASTADTGRILREGLRIAIVGPPNAGKSSLLNAILGMDRAIVTPIAGTTRDYIEESAELGGYPVVLIDTAGLRETHDPIEEMGVQKARALAGNADLIWLVTDSTESEAQIAWEFERPTLRIANKVDLSPAPAGFIGISCQTRQGLNELIERTLSAYRLQEVPFAIAPRHGPYLAEAKGAAEMARETLEHNRPSDLAVVSLTTAIQALGRITGETADEDMITRIFADFCIGK